MLLAMVAGIGKCYGQQADSAKKKSVTYLRNLLKTDTPTTQLVSDIQNNYKSAVKQVVGSGSISEHRKRELIDSLMSVKNRKLEELLPEDRRNLIIPTTERRRTWKRDTTVKKNGNSLK